MGERITTIIASAVPAAVPMFCLEFRNRTIHGFCMPLTRKGTNHAFAPVSSNQPMAVMPGACTAGSWDFPRPLFLFMLYTSRVNAVASKNSSANLLSLSLGDEGSNCANRSE